MAVLGLTTIQQSNIRGKLDARQVQEGLVGVPVIVDFSNSQDVTYDFSLLHSQNLFSIVRTLMLDNSGNPNPVYISVNNTGQKLTAPPYSLCCFPISARANSQIRFQTAGGGTAALTQFTYIEFFNYDIPPFVTNAFGPIVPGQISGVYGIDGSHIMSLSNPFASTPWQATTITNRNTTLGAGVASTVFPGGGAAVGIAFSNIGDAAGNGYDAWYKIGGVATGSFAAGDILLIAGSPEVVLPYRYSGSISFYSTLGTRIQAREFS